MKEHKKLKGIVKKAFEKKGKGVSELRVHQNKEDFYETLVKLSPAGILIEDVNGKILEINNELCKMLDYKREELLNENISKIVTPENRDKIKVNIQKLIEGKELIQEIESLRKDGGRCIIELRETSIVLPDGNRGVLSLARDITSQRKAEIELKNSEEKYRILVENSYEAISIVQDGILKFVNSTTTKILGYSIAEIINQPLSQFIYEEDREKVMGYHLSRGNRKDIPEKYSFRAIKKNGDIILVEIHIAPISWEGGPAFMGFMSDITQRQKQSEELLKAKIAAEAANNLKSEFLAQMSHEIRTPLNSMLSFASLIKEEIRENLNEDLKTSFELMDKSGNRIIRTIDHILNLSDVQKGAFECVPTELDIYSDVLVQLILKYGKVAKSKNLDLIYRLECDNPLLVADKYSVEQIFDNVIDNAIKYTPEGIVTIAVKKDNNRNVVIAVEDTGIGISEEFLPKIFDPFVQETTGYTRRFEGNGIGLALVKEFCRLNHIKIDVESKKNKGSKFTFTFPNKFENIKF